MTERNESARAKKERMRTGKAGCEAGRDEPGLGRWSARVGMSETSDERRSGERWRNGADEFADEVEEDEVDSAERSSTRRYRNSAAAAVCRRDSHQ